MKWCVFEKLIFAQLAKKFRAMASCNKIVLSIFRGAKLVSR
jgi:hypothetical protein